MRYFGVSKPFTFCSRLETLMMGFRSGFVYPWGIFEIISGDLRRILVGSLRIRLIDILWDIDRPLVGLRPKRSEQTSCLDVGIQSAHWKMTQGHEILHLKWY